MHTGIFGPGMHGKTTLAKFLSRKNFVINKVESLCLDPWAMETQWGKQAEVYNFAAAEHFWKRVWETEYKLVFIDEAATTINRDKDLVSVFTEIRHRHHKVVVIGHRAKQSLLPVMREQLSTVFLFSQTKKSVEDWVEDFANEDLRKAVGLPPHYFLHAVKGGKVNVRTLSEKERNL